MANAFDRLAGRMDEVTVLRMGIKVTVNGNDLDAVESHFIPELGPVSGDGISVVIFSSDYRPKRNDQVVMAGKTYIVTRHQLYNGKPQIWLE